GSSCGRGAHGSRAPRRLPQPRPRRHRERGVSTAAPAQVDHGSPPDAPADPAVLLETRELSVHFAARGGRGGSRGGPIRAVDRGSVRAPPGQTLRPVWGAARGT